MPPTSRSGAPSSEVPSAPASRPSTLLFRVMNAITGCKKAPAVHHMPSDHRLLLLLMANRAGRDHVYRWGVALLESESDRGASRIRECIRELVDRGWLVDLGLQGPANRALHAYEVRDEGKAWERATRRRETPTERRDRLGLPPHGRPTHDGGPAQGGRPGPVPREAALPPGGRPAIAPREAGVPPHGDKPLDQPLSDPLAEPINKPPIAHAREHTRGEVLDGDQALLFRPVDPPPPLAAGAPHGSAETAKGRRKPPPAPTEDALRVFTAYLKGRAYRQVKGPSPVLDAKRIKIVADRIAEGFPVETLCAAAQGIWLSQWHVEKDQARFDLALRDAEHIERFGALHHEKIAEIAEQRQREEGRIERPPTRLPGPPPQPEGPVDPKIMAELRAKYLPEAANG